LQAELINEIRKLDLERAEFLGANGAEDQEGGDAGDREGGDAGDRECGDPCAGMYALEVSSRFNVDLEGSEKVDGYVTAPSVRDILAKM